MPVYLRQMIDQITMPRIQSYQPKKLNSLFNMLSHTATSHAVLFQVPDFNSNPDSHE